MWSFCLQILAGILFASAGLPWSPQYGTARHPKIPGLSHSANQGDIFLIDGRHFRALTSFDLDDSALKNLPDERHVNYLWSVLKKGSYLLPKIFGEDAFCESGDFFLDVTSGKYYIADATGFAGNKMFYDRDDSFACAFRAANDESNWMTLLRPIIGDKRLGDIHLPAVHDAGTAGCDENSYLVDKNFLFQLGEKVSPATVANWSRTQPDRFDVMLASGFRGYDLRVADLGEVDGTFRWWHGVAGDEIEEGLGFIRDFATDHPEEILILDFGHFAAPGNALDPTTPIPDNRKDELSNIILSYLGARMAPKQGLPNNPTMNELLQAGNILVVMGDGYIQAKDDRYWPDVIHGAWAGETNPEGLFNERSGKLADFKENHADSMTDLSGCNTPDEKTVVAGLILVYGDNETIRNITEEIAPGITDIIPSEMSFEGLYMDLVTMAGEGTNTAGMWARPPDNYSSGSSVHYRGTNEMVRHWLARPQLFKLNIIFLDNAPTSTAVNSIIDGNKGDILPEVSVSHQGNPKDGFYEWEEFTAIGGTDALPCTPASVRITVSDGGNILYQVFHPDKITVTFTQGQYPPGSVLEVDVASQNAMESDYINLFSGVVQTMINTNQDLYIRGTDLGDGHGFAYIGTSYDTFADACDTTPLVGFDNLVRW